MLCFGSGFSARTDTTHTYKDPPDPAPLVGVITHFFVTAHCEYTYNAILALGIWWELVPGECGRDESPCLMPWP